MAATVPSMAACMKTCIRGQAASSKNGSALKKWTRCSLSRKYVAMAPSTSRPMA